MHFLQMSLFSIFSRFVVKKLLNVKTTPQGRGTFRRRQDVVPLLTHTTYHPIVCVPLNFVLRPPSYLPIMLLVPVNTRLANVFTQHRACPASLCDTSSARRRKGTSPVEQTRFVHPPTHMGASQTHSKCHHLNRPSGDILTSPTWSPLQGTVCISLY